MRRFKTSRGGMIGLLLVLPGFAWSQQVQFQPSKDVSGGSVSGVSCIDAGRIDGDGLADVAIIEGGKHAGGRRTFAWFQSPADPQGTWTRREINPGAPLRSFLGSAKLADMDNDGDLDLAVSSDNHSGSSMQADVYVFVNPGSGGVTGTWSYHRVTPGTLALHHINDMEIADLDGDGRKDIVVRSLEPNQIHIFFQNNISSYTRRTINTNISQSEGLAVGRIDGDARPDITFTGYWLKTPSDARNGTYNQFPIDSGYKDVNQNTKEATGDIDGDGLIDVVIGPAESFRNGGNHVLAWYKNPGGNYGSNWPRTVIRSGTNNHHTVKLADIDNDGDLDVVTGKPWSATGIAKESLIFYNNGSGGFGTTQVLASGKGLYTGVVHDIGNDGDLDIIGQDSYSGTSKPWLYESILSGAPSTPPTPPSGLTATVTSSSQINLTWTDTSGNETGFKIERASGGGAFSQIAAVGSNVKAYSSTGLAASTTYSYRVRANNSAGDSAYSNTATATTLAGGGSLPAPWLTQDIGAVAAAGSASASGGTFTIGGSGADIWGTADEFRYVYQPLTGDGTVTARVVSQGNTNGWAKAGPMIRESLAPNSKHAVMALTPLNGATFDRRTATGGTTSKTGAAGTAPLWVRLTRAGDLLSGHVSSNGTSWTAVGSVSVPMGADVLAGLAVTSHSDGAVSTVTFDNVSVTAEASVMAASFDGSDPAFEEGVEAAPDALAKDEGSARCGATGAEALLVLGLFAHLRRRPRSAGRLLRD